MTWFTVLENLSFYNEIFIGSIKNCRARNLPEILKKIDFLDWANVTCINEANNDFTMKYIERKTQNHGFTLN